MTKNCDPEVEFARYFEGVTPECQADIICRLTRIMRKQQREVKTK